MALEAMSTSNSIGRCTTAVSPQLLGEPVTGSLPSRILAFYHNIRSASTPLSLLRESTSGILGSCAQSLSGAHGRHDLQPRGRASTASIRDHSG